MYALVSLSMPTDPINRYLRGPTSEYSYFDTSAAHGNRCEPTDCDRYPNCSEEHAKECHSCRSKREDDTGRLGASRQEPQDELLTDDLVEVKLYEAELLAISQSSQWLRKRSSFG